MININISVIGHVKALLFSKRMLEWMCVHIAYQKNVAWVKHNELQTAIPAS